jgi:hypothetical protein
VRRTGERWTDRGKVQFDQIELVVYKTPKVEIGTDCEPGKDGAKLSLDGPADRVAYRCAGGPWHVFDLRRSPGRPFQRCATQPGDALDWASVPTFEAARSTLLGCHSGESAPTENAFKAIVAESRARGGDASAAVYLGETLGEDVRGAKQSGRDDWDAAFDALPEPQRKSLEPKLRAAIERDQPFPALLRALNHADLSDPALLDPLEKIGRRLGSTPPTPLDGDTPHALAIIVRALAKKRPAAAGAIACDAATRFAANGVSVALPREQLAIIASQKLQCNIDGVFSRNHCSENFACCASGFTCGAPRHACTDAELDALAKLELSRDAQNPWPNGGGFGYELLVAAAAVQDKSAAAKTFREEAKRAPQCAR